MPENLPSGPRIPEISDNNFSLNMRKCTFRHVRPTKIQFSLRIDAQSGLNLSWPHEETLNHWRSKLRLAKILNRLATAQAYLNFRPVRMSEDTLSDVVAHFITYTALLYHLSQRVVNPCPAE